MRTLYYLAMLVGICVVAMGGGLYVHGSAPAQEALSHGKDNCVTIEQLAANAKRNDPKIEVYYVLRDIDMGNEDPSTVVIFTNGHEFIGALFDHGCYVSYHVFKDEDDAHEFMMHFTKGANNPA